MKPNSQTAVFFLVVVGVAAVRGLPAIAVENLPSTDKTALVRQLGHSEYSRRKEAAAQLISLGLRARDALVTGLQSQDAEIRRRSHRILAQAV